jgi:predicted RNA-binding protein with PIN domain
MEERRQVLIVDGHSIVFSWADLRKIHRENPRRAMIELENRLVQHQDASGVSVVLVFDGKGSRLQSEREGLRIQVMYSDRGRTADDVVERLVAKYATRHEITVATDDYAEQETVRAFGAFAIDGAGLADLLKASDRKFRERLRRRFFIR